MSQPALVTAEEFEHFSEDEAHRVELVRGRLVRMSPVSPLHARIVPRLIRVLGDYLDDHPVGEILADCGFKLESHPDTVRGPDIAFVRQERISVLERPGFVRGAPDLAIEVLSPDDRPSEVREKLDDYFRAGVPVVVVIDPLKKSAAIYRSSATPVVVHGDEAVLDIGDPIPGFTCTLGRIFK